VIDELEHLYFIGADAGETAFETRWLALIDRVALAERTRCRHGSSTPVLHRDLVAVERPGNTGGRWRSLPPTPRAHGPSGGSQRGGAIRLRGRRTGRAVRIERFIGNAASPLPGLVLR
jgi:hypothetical protein